jgi:hypothetical protein
MEPEKENLAASAAIHWSYLNTAAVIILTPLQNHVQPFYDLV